MIAKSHCSASLASLRKLQGTAKDAVVVPIQSGNKVASFARDTMHIHVNEANPPMTHQ